MRDRMSVEMITVDELMDIVKAVHPQFCPGPECPCRDVDMPLIRIPNCQNCGADLDAEGKAKRHYLVTGTAIIVCFDCADKLNAADRQRASDVRTRTVDGVAH